MHILQTIVEKRATYTLLMHVDMMRNKKLGLLLYIILREINNSTVIPTQSFYSEIKVYNNFIFIIKGVQLCSLSIYEIQKNSALR